MGAFVLQNIDDGLGIIGSDAHGAVSEALQVAVSLGDVAQVRCAVKLDQILSRHEFQALPLQK